MRRSRSILAALVAAATLAIIPGQHGWAQGVLGESGLVGKLEGARSQRDAPRPAKLGEAPMLAELVKAGKLPPVEQRVPEEPLVIKPLHEIGKYGGTWRRGFTGPGDGENGNRINAVRQAAVLGLHRHQDRARPSPRAGSMSDGRQDHHAVSLRKGMKWSDGEPFTADDFVFWFEDIYQNKDIVPTPIADMSINGKPGKVEKVDETTVAVQVRRAVLPVPRHAGRRHADRRRPVGAAVAERSPSARYAPDALPEAVPAEVLRPRRRSTRRPRRPGFDNWVQHLHFKKDWRSTPSCRRSAPGRRCSRSTRRPGCWSATRTTTRSTPTGNQLPYIDKIVHDAGREPRGAQPARDRRRVRPAGAPHRHRQAAGVPGEPAEGQLHGPPRPGRQRLRHRRCRSTRATTADPEIAKWLHQRRLPPRAVARHRPRPAQRDVLARRRHAGLGGAGREHRRTIPGPEWRKQVVDARRQARPTRCSTRSASTKKDARGLPAAHRQRRAAAHRDHDRRRPSCPARSRPR